MSENGYGKRVPLSNFRKKALNRTGLIGYKVCIVQYMEKWINIFFLNCSFFQLLEWRKHKSPF